MDVLTPSVQIEVIDPRAIMRRIEKAYRVCYKSEGKMPEFGFTPKYVQRKLRVDHHDSPIEHEKITVTVVCDRGVTHEIVRHRIASYSQESTRYCNYGGNLKVIRPDFWVDGSPIFRTDNPNYAECLSLWMLAMQAAEDYYSKLLTLGATPQEARSVLPNSTKTEIVMTMDLREWRHFLNLRSLGTTGKPHPQMKQVADMILAEFKELLPEIFGDLEVVV